MNYISIFSYNPSYDDFFNYSDDDGYYDYYDYSKDDYSYGYYMSFDDDFYDWRRNLKSQVHSSTSGHGRQTEHSGRYSYNPSSSSGMGTPNPYFYGDDNSYSSYSYFGSFSYDPSNYSYNSYSYSSYSYDTYSYSGYNNSFSYSGYNSFKNNGGSNDFEIQGVNILRQLESDYWMTFNKDTIRRFVAYIRQFGPQCLHSSLEAYLEGIFSSSYSSFSDSMSN